MSIVLDTLSVSAEFVPLILFSQILHSDMGDTMAKIVVDALTNEDDIDEAITHLRNTMKNSHDVHFAKWCEEEIDRMLDEKLERSK